MPKLPALCSFLFAWYAISAQSAAAVTATDKPSNACFLHYTTDQGLSNDHITAIAKDRLGFLWVGTVNGLNRFDGRSFKIFRRNPRDKNSIPGDDITGITPAPDGYLWVTTSRGLCKLDPVRLAVERIPLLDNADTLNDGIITKLAFDSKGMAWTTSESGIHGIRSVTGRQEFFFKTEQKTVGWYCMLIDKQDRLWMIKETLHRFDPAARALEPFKGVEPGESFAPLFLARDFSGKIWVGSWGYGIREYDAERDMFIRHPHSPGLAAMLLPDTTASGKPFLWVGGGSSGLGIYEPGTHEFTEFRPDPRDPFTHNNYISTAFFRDPSGGDVWIGTEVGLEHYAPATVRFERTMIPLEKDMNQFSLVSSVVRDNTDERRYFIGVWGTGLFAWNKTAGTFARIKPARPKLTTAGIFKLFQDRQGYLWECLNYGLRRYDPRRGTWREYKDMFQHPERSNAFLCGLEDRRGDLWFGSNKDGLFRYNRRSDRVEPVLLKKELANEKGDVNITDLSEDAQGRLWLACNSGGLVRFDPASGDWKQFYYTGQDIPVACNAVKAGRNGRIYAAFYGAFLELDAEGKLLRHFTQQNGLKSNRLFFIVEDRQGKIWFNSEYLLHCFDPASGDFNYYGKPDGLFSNTMTDALSATPGGEIFVGFQNAFNFFYPERLRRNLQPPPVAVTSIKVMNKERPIPVSGLISSAASAAGQDSILVLGPEEDFFEVEFAALNFNQQERNRYAYLLESFNKDWVFTERPLATFTNLDGGTYLLRMKAANNDGVWNEQGATLTIRVNPPFHRTWQFFVLMLMAAAGTVTALLWFRRQQRRRLEKFREGLARDLHDEMGSTLSSIHFFSEFASREIGDDKPRVTPVLQRISQSAGTLSESMQDIIWAMKTKNDQLEDLAAHMTDFGLRLLEARKVDFKTHVSADFSGKHLRPEVRRNIYLIFKEAVNNAAKYSEAMEVELHIALKKGLLLMKISDNGKGFERDTPRTAGSGNGLQNMQRRAVDIGGTLEIFSRPGEGTRVELRVKV